MTSKSEEFSHVLCILFSAFSLKTIVLNSVGTTFVWELGELNCHPLKSLFLTGQIFQNLLLRTFSACSFLGDIFIFNNNQLEKIGQKNWGILKTTKK